MTESDIKNLNRIEEIVKAGMGYSKESFDYFKRELYEPFIDEEFKKILGSDLRRRYPIDNDNERIASIFAENDKAYAYFKTYFRCILDYYPVTYQEFIKNKIMVEKNETKIPKFLCNAYKSNVITFTSDYSSNIGRAISLRSVSEDEIVAYISKAFETIGRYKTSSEDLELVVSCNFADIFLCSAGQSWTSCFDIEKGFYWYGVPGLIGDKSRAFVYISDGSRKEVLGIKTDSFKMRSWILLDEKNKKNLVKFYPSESISEKLVREITGDKSYSMGDKSRLLSKNPVELLYFDNGTACTVSNDISKLTRKDDKFYHSLYSGGGIQYYCKGKTNIEEKGNLNAKETPYLPSLLARKITLSSCLKSFNCKCGNPYVVTAPDGETMCADCYTKKYNKCARCGKAILRTDIHELDNQYYCRTCYISIKKVECPCCKNKVSQEKMTSRGVCDVCYKLKYYTCGFCGKVEEREKMKTGEHAEAGVFMELCKDCHKMRAGNCLSCGKEYLELGAEKVCQPCRKEYFVKCLGCKSMVDKRTLSAIHTTKEGKELLIRRCPSCFSAKDYIFKDCCKTYWIKERLNKDGSCPTCNPEKKD